MNLKDLEILLAVVRRGSFAAVAREQGVDPSSISRSIAALEADLGLRLLQRSTRRLSLTDAGASYCRRIEPLVEELRAAGDAARSAARAPSGRLRLTASVAFGEACLVPLLPAFRRAYPEILLDLVLSDANLDLLGEQMDLAIRLAPRIEGDLIGVKLRDTHYRVCASPAYLGEGGNPGDPAALAAHDCIRLDLPGYRDRWRFKAENGREEAVAVTGGLLLSSPLASLSCARAGLGPALLADWLVERDLEQGALVDLFPGIEVTATSFETAAWLIYPSRRYLPARVRAGIDFLRQALGR